MTDWPIRQLAPSLFILEDRRGKRLSWHRTKSGVLIPRTRRIIEDQSHGSL